MNRNKAKHVQNRNQSFGLAGCFCTSALPLYILYVQIIISCCYCCYFSYALRFFFCFFVLCASIYVCNSFLFLSISLSLSFSFIQKSFRKQIVEVNVCKMCLCFCCLLYSFFLPYLTNLVCQFTCCVSYRSITFIFLCVGLLCKQIYKS